MKNILIAGLTLACWVLPVAAQVTNVNSSEAARRARALEADLERRMFNMRALEARMRNLSKRDAQSQEAVPGLSKETKERIQRLRGIDVSEVEKYLPLLSQKKAGAFKLFPNWDCLSENLVRLDGECSSFVPQSSDFSFRDVGYVDPHYRDLGFERGEMVGTGFFSQGILVSLGDTPIETLGTAHPAVAFLRGVPVAKTPADARAASLNFEKGVQNGGYVYSSHLPPVPGTTYVLRVIAYKLANSLPPPSVKSSMMELRFLSLNVDERSDVTVAFRVVSRGEADGLTVVWHELSRRNAPKIKFPKGEPLQDFVMR